MDGVTPSFQTIQVPVIIPPELADLTKELIELKGELRREINHYRENSQPLSYSEKEVAAMFDIATGSLEKIRRAGRISYTRVAGKIRYTRAQIEDYLEREQTKRSKK